MSLGGDIVNFRYKELREYNNLKQQDIAKIFGVTRLTYNKWELLINDMPLDTCNILANYYNVSVDYLLGRTNDKQYSNSLDKINYDIMCQRLKELRKKNKLSQREVGSKVGFPTTTYAYYERGDNIPSTLKLFYIAEFYHCSIDYLLGRINDSMIEEPIQTEEPQEIEPTPNNCIRIKELRKKNKLKQVDIANLLNMGTPSYYKCEKLINDISLINCNKLANYYNVSIDYLLGISNILQYDNYINKEINFSIMKKRLKQQRQNAGLTQIELSKKIGYSQAVYSDYENGDKIPATSKLLDIVSYYHISMDYILGRTDIDNLN